MSDLKITITAPDLAAAINNLAAAIANKNAAPADKLMVNPTPAQSVLASAARTSHIATQTPAPVLATTNAVPTAPTPVNASPIAIPVPVAPVVPTAAPTYTLEMIAAAGSSLIDTGKCDALMALLGKYGVDNLTNLAPEYYGAIATDLRALGARI